MYGCTERPKTKVRTSDEIHALDLVYRADVSFASTGPVSSRAHVCGVFATTGEITTRYSVVLGISIACLLTESFFFLVYYVVRRTELDWFKFSVTILRFFSVMIEISSREKPKNSVPNEPMARKQDEEHEPSQLGLMAEPRKRQGRTDRSSGRPKSSSRLTSSSPAPQEWRDRANFRGRSQRIPQGEAQLHRSGIQSPRLAKRKDLEVPSERNVRRSGP